MLLNNCPLQVTIALRDLVLRDFALTRLEILKFSSIRDNVSFKAIWNTRSVAALVELTR
jgi:predicted transglutaminase-like protease